MKIRKIQLFEENWQLVLLIENMLNSLYELILIISRTANADIHLEFRIYNAIFEHFDAIKEIMSESTYLYKNIINTTCDKAITKTKKYYSRTEDKKDLLYNLTAILNSINKLNMYKSWDQDDDDNDNDENISHEYKERYKKEFKNFFRRYYESRVSDSILNSQKNNEINQIMQKDNAIIIMLIVCKISRMLLKRYCDNQDVLDNIRMSLIDILILILLRMIF